MDTAQIWAVIGVLATALFGTLTLITTMFTRVLRSEIGSVRSEIGSVRNEIGGVRNEIGSLREEVAARFQAVHARLDGMDRDVQLLMNREFGTGRNG